jgi:opacity protein-like surface antigen
MLIAHAVAVVALALALPAAAADCVYPRSPATMPDGATATLDEMKAAKKEYDQYNSDMSVYLECLRTDHEATAPKIDDSMSAKQKEAMKKQIEDDNKRFVAKYDSAVDELHSIMDRFNEQIRTFNAARKAARDKKNGG